MPAAPTTSDDFLALVEKSGLLARTDAEACLARSPAASAKDAAELLVREGLLTRFQIEQLLKGRWRNFFISGKYKLLDTLGAGGMGSVFLCEHQVLKRRVALKVLPPDQADDPAALERFHREGRVAAALDHPNVVKVHDVDRDGKMHYLVLEYVEGATLHDVVKRKGPLDPVRAAHYIAQTALGLQHAHETAHIVHRDIKPANLLLDRCGTVKILDMGLARFFHDQTDPLTREHDSRNILGTADYLAPEQALDSHDVDIRADIYSLGATFYFLLTGQPPFAEGTLHQKLIWHQMRQPESVRSLRPEVPAEMAAILEAMMAKDPNQRYQLPVQVAQALAPWLAVPIPLPPEDEMPERGVSGAGSGNAAVTPSASAETMPSPRKPTGIQAAAPSSGVAGVNVGPPSAIERIRDQKIESPIDRGVDWDRVRHWTHIGLMVLVVLAAASGITWWATHQGGEKVAVAPTTTEPVASPPPTKPQGPPARGVFAARQRTTTVGLVEFWTGHSKPVERVAVSRDGRDAFTCSHDGTVRQWDVPSGQTVHVFTGHTGIVHDVSIRPSGNGPVKQFASVGHDKSVRVWDVVWQRQLRVYSGHQSRVHSVAYSPDGKKLATGSGDIVAGKPKDCVIRLFDPEKLEVIGLFSGHEHSVWGLAFSPDGKQLASVSYDRTVRVWDTANFKEIWKGSHEGTVHAVAWAPWGNLLASASGDRTVKLWDSKTGKLVRTLSGHGANVAGVAFSPDGRFLASTCDDQIVRLWQTGSGRLVAVFHRHARQAWGAAFLPGGKQLLTVSTDSRVALWNLPAFVQTAEVKQLHTWKTPGKPQGLAVSPSGAQMVTVDDGRNIILWDTFTGKELRRLSGSHEARPVAACFSSDGRLLATGDVRGRAVIWELAAGKPLRQLDHAEGVCSLAFTPDNLQLLAGYADGLARLWQARTGQPVLDLSRHEGPVNVLAIAPSGRVAVTGSWDKTAIVWDLKTGRRLRHYDGHKEGIQALALSPDGSLVASSGSDRGIHLWRLATGKLHRTLPGHASTVTALAFTPDGRRLISGGADREMLIWDLSAARPLSHTLRGHTQEITALAVTSSGRHAVSCGLDQSVRLWGLPALKADPVGEILRFNGHEKGIERVALSPDGRQVALAGLDGRVTLWEVESGQPLGRLEGQHRSGARFASFSSDGKLLATSGDDGVAIWDLGKKALLRKLEWTGTRVWSAVFTPDGQQVFGGGGNGQTVLWQLSSGKVVQEFEGAARDVNMVAVTPDGKLGLGASWDGAVHVWDLQTGEQRHRFTRHGKEVRALTLSPDGKQAISAGDDQHIRIWDIETGTEIRAIETVGSVYAVAMSPDGRQIAVGGADRILRVYEAATGQLRHVHGDHQGYIGGLCFLPDSRRLVSVSQDRSARLIGLPPLLAPRPR